MKARIVHGPWTHPTLYIEDGEGNLHSIYPGMKAVTTTGGSIEDVPVSPEEEESSIFDLNEVLRKACGYEEPF